ncbi:MAG: prepilin-type N-terminal cleavage/methylation domain-containing protein [Candidatus Methylomirabilales bacterium]
MSIPRRQAGLTLLELVIALSILSLLGVLALEAFRMGSRSWRRGEERAEVQQRVRVLAGMLAADLSAVQPTTALVGGRPVVVFTGTADRIHFHAAPDPHEPAPAGGMVRSLAYFLEPGRGLLVQKSYPLMEEDASLEPRGPVQVLDAGITRLRFRYLAAAQQEDGEPRWEDEWDPRDTGAPGGAVAGTAAADPPLRQSGLPLAVEVTLALGQGRGAREVQLVVPLRVGRGA